MPWVGGRYYTNEAYAEYSKKPGAKRSDRDIQEGVNRQIRQRKAATRQYAAEVRERKAAAPAPPESRQATIDKAGSAVDRQAAEQARRAAAEAEQARLQEKVSAEIRAKAGKISERSQAELERIQQQTQPHLQALEVLGRQLDTARLHRNQQQYSQVRAQIVSHENALVALDRQRLEAQGTLERSSAFSDLKARMAVRRGYMGPTGARMGDPDGLLRKSYLERYGQGGYTASQYEVKLPDTKPGETGYGKKVKSALTKEFAWMGQNPQVWDTEEGREWAAGVLDVYYRAADEHGQVVQEELEAVQEKERKIVDRFYKAQESGNEKGMEKAATAYKKLSKDKRYQKLMAELRAVYGSEALVSSGYKKVKKGDMGLMRFFQMGSDHVMNRVIERQNMIMAAAQARRTQADIERKAGLATIAEVLDMQAQDIWVPYTGETRKETHEEVFNRLAAGGQDMDLDALIRAGYDRQPVIANRAAEVRGNPTLNSLYSELLDSGFKTQDDLKSEGATAKIRLEIAPRAADNVMNDWVKSKEFEPPSEQTGSVLNVESYRREDGVVYYTDEVGRVWTEEDTLPDDMETPIWDYREGNETPVLEKLSGYEGPVEAVLGLFGGTDLNREAAAADEKYYRAKRKAVEAEMARELGIQWRGPLDTIPLVGGILASWDMPILLANQKVEQYYKRKMGLSMGADSRLFDWDIDVEAVARQEVEREKQLPRNAIPGEKEGRYEYARYGSDDAGAYFLYVPTKGVTGPFNQVFDMPVAKPIKIRRGQFIPGTTVEPLFYNSNVHQKYDMPLTQFQAAAKGVAYTSGDKATLREDDMKRVLPEVALKDEYDRLYYEREERLYRKQLLIARDGRSYEELSSEDWTDITVTPYDPNDLLGAAQRAAVEGTPFDPDFMNPFGSRVTRATSVHDGRVRTEFSFGVDVAGLHFRVPVRVGFDHGAVIEEMIEDEAEMLDAALNKYGWRAHAEVAGQILPPFEFGNAAEFGNFIAYAALDITNFLPFVSGARRGMNAVRAGVAAGTIKEGSMVARLGRSTYAAAKAFGTNPDQLIMRSGVARQVRAFGGSDADVIEWLQKDLRGIQDVHSLDDWKVAVSHAADTLFERLRLTNPQISREQLHHWVEKSLDDILKDHVMLFSQTDEAASGLKAAQARDDGSKVELHELQVKIAEERRRLDEAAQEMEQKALETQRRKARELAGNRGQVDARERVAAGDSGTIGQDVTVTIQKQGDEVAEQATVGRTVDEAPVSQADEDFAARSVLTAEELEELSAATKSTWTAEAWVKATEGQRMAAIQQLNAVRKAARSAKRKAAAKTKRRETVRMLDGKPATPRSIAIEVRRLVKEIGRRQRQVQGLPTGKKAERMLADLNKVRAELKRTAAEEKRLNFIVKQREDLIAEAKERLGPKYKVVDGKPVRVQKGKFSDEVLEAELRRIDKELLGDWPNIQSVKIRLRELLDQRSPFEKERDRLIAALNTPGVRHHNLDLARAQNDIERWSEAVSGWVGYLNRTWDRNALADLYKTQDMMIEGGAKRLAKVVGGEETRLAKAAPTREAQKLALQKRNALNAASKKQPTTRAIPKRKEAYDEVFGPYPEMGPQNAYLREALGQAVMEVRQGDGYLIEMRAPKGGDAGLADLNFHPLSKLRDHQVTKDLTDIINNGDEEQATAAYIALANLVQTEWNRLQTGIGNAGQAGKGTAYESMLAGGIYDSANAQNAIQAGTHIRVAQVRSLKGSPDPSVQMVFVPEEPVHFARVTQKEAAMALDRKVMARLRKKYRDEDGNPTKSKRELEAIFKKEIAAERVKEGLDGDYELVMGNLEFTTARTADDMTVVSQYDDILPYHDARRTVDYYSPFRRYDASDPSHYYDPESPMAYIMGFVQMNIRALAGRQPGGVGLMDAVGFERFLQALHTARNRASWGRHGEYAFKKNMQPIYELFHRVRLAADMPGPHQALAQQRLQEFSEVALRMHLDPGGFGELDDITMMWLMMDHRAGHLWSAPGDYMVNQWQRMARRHGLLPESSMQMVGHRYDGHAIGRQRRMAPTLDPLFDRDGAVGYPSPSGGGRDGWLGQLDEETVRTGRVHLKKKPGVKHPKSARWPETYNYTYGQDVGLVSVVQTSLALLNHNAETVGFYAFGRGSAQSPSVLRAIFLERAIHEQVVLHLDGALAQAKRGMEMGPAAEVASARVMGDHYWNTLRSGRSIPDWMVDFDGATRRYVLSDEVAKAHGRQSADWGELLELVKKGVIERESLPVSYGKFLGHLNSTRALHATRLDGRAPSYVRTTGAGGGDNPFGLVTPIIEKVGDKERRTYPAYAGKEQEAWTRSIRSGIEFGLSRNAPYSAGTGGYKPIQAANKQEAVFAFLADRAFWTDASTPAQGAARADYFLDEILRLSGGNALHPDYDVARKLVADLYAPQFASLKAQVRATSSSGEGMFLARWFLGYTKSPAPMGKLWRRTHPGVDWRDEYYRGRAFDDAKTKQALNEGQGRDGLLHEGRLSDELSDTRYKDEHDVRDAFGVDKESEPYIFITPQIEQLEEDWVHLVDEATTLGDSVETVSRRGPKPEDVDAAIVERIGPPPEYVPFKKPAKGEPWPEGQVRTEKQHRILFDRKKAAYDRQVADTRKDLLNARRRKEVQGKASPRVEAFIGTLVELLGRNHIDPNDKQRLLELADDVAKEKRLAPYLQEAVAEARDGVTFVVKARNQRVYTPGTATPSPAAKAFADDVQKVPPRRLEDTSDIPGGGPIETKADYEARKAAALAKQAGKERPPAPFEQEMSRSNRLQQTEADEYLAMRDADARGALDESPTDEFSEPARTGDDILDWDGTPPAEVVFHDAMIEVWETLGKSEVNYYEDLRQSLRRRWYDAKGEERARLKEEMDSVGLAIRALKQTRKKAKRSTRRQRSAEAHKGAQTVWERVKGIIPDRLMGYYAITEKGMEIEHARSMVARLRRIQRDNRVTGGEGLPPSVMEAFDPEQWDELTALVAEYVRGSVGRRRTSLNIGAPIKPLDPEEELDDLLKTVKDNDPRVRRAVDRALTEYSKRTGNQRWSRDLYWRTRTLVRHSQQRMSRGKKLLNDVEGRMDEFLIARRQYADNEAFDHIRQLLYDNPGLSPEDAARHFELSMAQDGVIRDVSESITEADQQILERMAAHYLGVKHADVQQMTDAYKTALQAENTLPDFTNGRFTMREEQVRIGAWSPRSTEEASVNGAWSLEDEKHWWMDRYGTAPAWVTDARLQPGGSAFNSYDEYLGVLRELRAFDDAARIARATEGKQAFDIDDLIYGNAEKHLKPRRDFATQRRWFEERYGTAVAVNGEFRSAPWLMTPDEIIKWGRKNSGNMRGLITDKAQVEEVLRAIDSVTAEYMEEYLQTVRMLPEELRIVGPQDYQRFAFEVVQRLGATQPWLSFWEKLPRRALDVWSSIWTGLVLWHPAFTVSNAIDQPTKAAVFTLADRYGSLVPSDEARRAVPTLESVGHGETTSLFLAPEVTIHEKFGMAVRGEMGGRDLLSLAGETVHSGLAQAVLPGIERRSKLALAQRMYDKALREFNKDLADGVYADLLKGRVLTDEMKSLMVRKQVGDRLHGYFPSLATAGLGERLLNKLLPFISYNAKNNVLWVSFMLDHPYLITPMLKAQELIADHNRKEWAKEHGQDAFFPEHLANQIRVGDTFVDIANFTDWARGSDFLFRNQDQPLTLAEMFDQVVRVQPSQRAVWDRLLFDVTGHGGRMLYRKELGEDGLWDGWSYYQDYVAPLTPWGNPVLDIGDYLPLTGFFQTIQSAVEEGELTGADVAKMFWQVALFNEGGRVSRYFSLNSQYYQLRQKSERLAREWLATEDGQELTEMWRQREYDPVKTDEPFGTEVKMNSYMDLFMEKQEDGSYAMRAPSVDEMRKRWFQQQMPEVRTELMEDFNQLYELGKAWDAYIDDLDPNDREAIDKAWKMRRATEMSLYQQNPMMMEYQGFGMTGEEVQQYQASSLIDSQRDTFYELYGYGKRPEDGAEAEVWEQERIEYLEANPEFAATLADEASSYQAALNQVQTNLQLAMDNFEGQEVLREWARQRDDDELVDAANTMGELNATALGMEAMGYDEKGEFRFQQDSRVRRLLRGDDPRDVYYSDAMAGAAREATNEAGEFDVRQWWSIIDRNPQLKDRYLDSKGKTQEEWQQDGKYYDFWHRFGQLAEKNTGDSWTKAWESWDAAPEWLKEKYKANAPAKFDEFVRNRKYSAWMDKFTGYFEKKQFKRGWQFFYDMPEWAREKYYEKHPGRRLSEGQHMAYLSSLDRVFQNIDAGRWDKAESIWKSMDPWMRTMYYKNNPKSTLFRGKRFTKSSGYKPSGGGSSDYSRLLDAVFGAIDAGNWNGAEHVWRSAPASLREQYYRNNPDSTLFRGGYKSSGTSYGRTSYKRTSKSAALSDPQFRVYMGYMQKWVDLMKTGSDKEAQQYFAGLPSWAKDFYLARNPDKKWMKESDRNLALLSDYLSRSKQGQQEMKERRPEFARWLNQYNNSESWMGAVMYGYEQLPDDPWLKRVYKERYPEVFSKEAQGQRKIDAVMDILAQHPDFQEPWMRWYQHIARTMVEALQYMTPRPKQVTLDRSRMASYRRGGSAEEVAKRPSDAMRAPQYIKRSPRVS